MFIFLHYHRITEKCRNSRHFRKRSSSSSSTFAFSYFQHQPTNHPSTNFTVDFVRLLCVECCSHFLSAWRYYCNTCQSILWLPVLTLMYSLMVALHAHARTRTVFCYVSTIVLTNYYLRSNIYLQSQHSLCITAATCLSQRATTSSFPSSRYWRLSYTRLKIILSCFCLV